MGAESWESKIDVPVSAVNCIVSRSFFFESSFLRDNFNYISLLYRKILLLPHLKGQKTSGMYVYEFCQVHFFFGKLKIPLKEQTIQKQTIQNTRKAYLPITKIYPLQQTKKEGKNN